MWNEICYQDCVVICHLLLLTWIAVLGSSDLNTVPTLCLLRASTAGKKKKQKSVNCEGYVGQGIDTLGNVPPVFL